MKKTVLAIAFAVATAFAAQTPANPPANNSGKAASTATKTKKHHSKATKSNAAAKPSTGAGATTQK
jgi:hypothetical protein